MPSDTGDDGSGVQVVLKDTVTAALPPSVSAQQAALLRFKPSSRDVISGIAPHVFDDQRSSYRPRRRRQRRPSPESRRRSVSPPPHRSPLRLSVVISVEDHGASIIQPKAEDSIVLEVYAAQQSASLSLPLSSVTRTTPISATKNKPKHSTFNIPRVLKTFVLRLK
ncbi:hypothetical protein C8F04DRAFT_333645 [Mycena alexandri]|uniref:Uncharacterized protein n=1 Tax=Mycena alexandri TaxID=1745969 RepID=A0AAD6WNP4_9AGAR|nr:hypothetical protein C8F04DRAFT_333645 [Mycena alexandri]